MQPWTVPHTTFPFLQFYISIIQNAHTLHFIYMLRFMMRLFVMSSRSRTSSFPGHPLCYCVILCVFMPEKGFKCTLKGR